MAKRPEEIRIGFLLSGSSTWIGGYNYIKNLLYAIKHCQGSHLYTIVFVSPDFDIKYKQELAEFAEVRVVNILSEKTAFWYIWKLVKKITNSDFIIELYLFRYNIDIFSHSSLINLIFKKSINWIADFQHLKLPHMFSESEIRQRNILVKNITRFSSRVVLSSKSALTDFEEYFGKNEKIKILQFVSQPGNFVETNECEIEKIKLKYEIKEEYFIIPNQLWKHKNHLVVLEALKYLKEKNQSIKVVFTGLLNDYRDSQYPELINKKIQEYGVDVLMLGLIDYKDMILLIKGSVSVINPSLFEGWSTIVEECKSLGKNIILSNIPVHIEQSPIFSTYFSPENYIELADILIDHSNNIGTYKHLYNFKEFENNLNIQTSQFYKRYLKIIDELINE
jgi:glycosyltransferase involved in cell wall biosynthesis